MREVIDAAFAIATICFGAGAALGILMLFLALWGEERRK